MVRSRRHAAALADNLPSLVPRCRRHLCLDRVQDRLQHHLRHLGGRSVRPPVADLT